LIFAASAAPHLVRVRSPGEPNAAGASSCRVSQGGWEGRDTEQYVGTQKRAASRPRARDRKEGAERAARARLVKDIFGNPFRPVAVDRSWLTSTVVSLAQGIYADRAFDRLPILADALQDAGCENADVLGHCRGPGPHVRGCWVVDLLLGKQ